MWNSSTNNDDLRTLLERLYPHVHIANRGVALLAAQIHNLGNECDFIGDRVGFAATAPHVDQVVAKTFTTVPVIRLRTNYGTNNYPK